MSKSSLDNIRMRLTPGVIIGLYPEAGSRSCNPSTSAWGETCGGNPELIPAKLPERLEEREEDEEEMEPEPPPPRAYGDGDTLRPPLGV